MKTILLASSLLLAANTYTSAQIPPVNVKPVPMTPRDTLSQAIASPRTDYITATDPENGELVFKGTFTFADMSTEPNFSWLPRNMDSYKPSADALQTLHTLLPGHKLLVFMGTWCSDSHEMVPALYKTLQSLNYRYENLYIVGMDRSKTSYGAAVQLVSAYKAMFLPTIVVLDDNNQEVGRITETVQKSVEQDLADILKSAK